MKKSFALLSISILSAFVLSCGSAQLKKSDINKMPDKQFFLSSVSVKYSLDKEFYQTPMGLDGASLEKDAFAALPVDDIVKSVSAGFGIKINTEDFKKVDLKTIANNWDSKKAGTNTVSIVYHIREIPGRDLEIAATFLYIYCKVTLTNAEGLSREIMIGFPEKEHTAFNPIKAARSTNLKPADIAKTLILQSEKSIPARLTAEFNKVVD